MNKALMLKKRFVSVLQTIRAKNLRQEDTEFENGILKEIKAGLESLGVKPIYTPTNVKWFNEMEVGLWN